MVRLSAGQQGYRGRLGHAQVRQLQQDDQEVFRAELQIAALAALLCLVVSAAPVTAQPANEAFPAALAELPDAGFADKEAIVARLVETGHSSTAAVLTAMLEDRLYVRTSDHRVFITTSADDTQTSFSLIDPLTLKGAGASPAGELTKIDTNNRLRRVLRTTTARFALSNPDPGV